MTEFMDCPYRFLVGDELHCRNKADKGNCDNCTENIHLNCENYVAKNDMCLQYFELGISDV